VSSFAERYAAATPIEPTALNPTEARALIERIKTNIAAVWELVTQAYTRRAWSALGYESWDDYCAQEFGTSRLRLPREERTEVISSLREAGLSVRAISATTGYSAGTVHGELSGVQNRTPQPTEDREVQTDDRLADPSDRPEKITGLDGKTYPATPKQDISSGPTALSGPTPAQSSSTRPPMASPSSSESIGF